MQINHSVISACLMCCAAIFGMRTLAAVEGSLSMQLPIQEINTISAGDIEKRFRDKWQPMPSDLKFILTKLVYPDAAQMLMSNDRISYWIAVDDNWRFWLLRYGGIVSDRKCVGPYSQIEGNGGQ